MRRATLLLLGLLVAAPAAAQETAAQESTAQETAAQESTARETRAGDAAATEARRAELLRRWTRGEEGDSHRIPDPLELLCVTRRGPECGCPGGPPWSAPDLRAVLERLRRCYERELRSDPALRGRVDYEVRFGPSGRAIAVRVVRDELEAPTVVACMQRVLLSSRVDPGPRPAPSVVVVPLIFEPGRTAARRE